MPKARLEPFICEIIAGVRHTSHSDVIANETLAPCALVLAVTVYTSCVDMALQNLNWLVIAISILSYGTILQQKFSKLWQNPSMGQLQKKEPAHDSLGG